MANGSCGSGFNKDFSFCKNRSYRLPESFWNEVWLKVTVAPLFFYLFQRHYGTLRCGSWHRSEDRKGKHCFQLLVCPLVCVVGLLQGWYYNEQPTDRLIPGTYIRTSGSCQQTVSYYHLKHSWERHQGIQGTGSMHRTDAPVWLMAKLLHRYIH